MRAQLSGQRAILLLDPILCLTVAGRMRPLLRQSGVNTDDRLTRNNDCIATALSAPFVSVPSYGGQLSAGCLGAPGNLCGRHAGVCKLARMHGDSLLCLGGFAAHPPTSQGVPPKGRSAYPSGLCKTWATHPLKQRHGCMC